MGALLLAVLLPTACLLWFMNEAVANERLAVRQRLQEAYQGELTSRQERVEQTWIRLRAQMQQTQDKPAAEAFAALVNDGASSALIFRGGQLAYPASQIVPTAEEKEAGQRAAELLAQAREMIRAGRVAEGCKILRDTLQAKEFEAARDDEGRLIPPNAALLAIDSLPPASPDQLALAHQLAEKLRHYDGPAISSPQRFFLMQQVHALTAEPFPTMEAERQALQLAETAPAQSAETAALHQAPGSNLWLYEENGACAVFNENDLASRIKEAIGDPPQGTAITLRAPRFKEPPDVFISQPTGGVMQDWAIDLSLRGTDPFGEAARSHVATYFWTAAVAIAAIALLAAVLGITMSRQMKLTRLKNDLIATVSHELKTPLASMRVLVDTLLEGRIAGAREQREYLTLIGRENVRLSRLIDNFLTFSRMERRKAAFDFRQIRVAKVLSEAVAAMGERGAAIQVEAPANLQIWGDEDALVTVVVNLLDNALKYSDPGTRVQLSAQDNAGFIEITVRDQGIGIARRHHRRIFQRFYQIDRALSRRAGGCGLGLAIVDYIVRGHRGSISVTSIPGKGSTFGVRLPTIREKLAVDITLRAGVVAEIRSIETS